MFSVCFVSALILLVVYCLMVRRVAFATAARSSRLQEKRIRASGGRASTARVLKLLSGRASRARALQRQQRAAIIYLPVRNRLNVEHDADVHSADAHERLIAACLRDQKQGVPTKNGGGGGGSTAAPHVALTQSLSTTTIEEFTAPTEDECRAARRGQLDLLLDKTQDETRSVHSTRSRREDSFKNQVRALLA